MNKIGKITSVSIMEPLMPEMSRHPELVDLATDLVSKTSALAAQLNPKTTESIGNLVRSMNCYYSNLIEGHDTHPFDIERALANHFSSAPKKRALQLEAKAHIEIQQMIDHNDVPFGISTDYIQWIHRAFCERLPKELLWVENPDTGKKSYVEPGHFRNDWVKVGHHVPPDPKEIGKFLDRFSQAYNLTRFTKIQSIIAVAASHHRLLWIHPFLDGNGRVARLFSHAFLYHISVGSSLWSVSRGVARNVDEYKARLMEADNVRQGDLDGRGNLSAKGLKEFCIFFLETCLDQINYMSSLIEPTELLRRIELYIEEEQRKKQLPKGSFPLLREALFSGEFERGKAPSITSYQERQARSTLNALIKANLLVSDTPKGPVRLNFPMEVVERWFPKLYPIGIEKSKSNIGKKTGNV